MFNLSGRQFLLAKVGLVRAGCPGSLNNLPGNKTPDGPLIVLKNTERLGYVQATDYCPTGVMVSGNRYRTRLIEAGLVRSWAYVECGALEIKADDAIGSSELMQKLDSLLLEKLYGVTKAPITGQPWPYIQEVYPFENYFIYTFKGQKYRQHFNLDPIERKVALTGGSTAVQEKFVNAGEAKESMPRSETGARYAYAPTRGNVQSFTTGGRTSELVTQTIRNWKNILEAVAMFLNYIKSTDNRTPMRPSFYPVNLTPDHKLATALQAKGVDLYDFAKWSAAEQGKTTKKVAGEDLGPSAFAYVGSPRDASTWHLPIKFQDKAKSASHVRNALARVNQVKGIPESAKAGVMGKLHKHAKHHGIDVQDKATPKQKTWMKKGKVAAGGPGSGRHKGSGGGGIVKESERIKTATHYSTGHPLASPNKVLGVSLGKKWSANSQYGTSLSYHDTKEQAHAAARKYYSDKPHLLDQ